MIGTLVSQSTHSDVRRSSSLRVPGAHLRSLDSLLSRNEDHGQASVRLASDGEVVGESSTGDPVRNANRTEDNIRNKLLERRNEKRDGEERNATHHFFVPLMTQCFPSDVFSALHLRPETSDPAKASEIARAMNFSPRRTAGTTSALRASDPKLRMGGRPITFPPPRPSP